MIASTAGFLLGAFACALLLGVIVVTVIGALFDEEDDAI